MSPRGSLFTVVIAMLLSVGTARAGSVDWSQYIDKDAQRSTVKTSPKQSTRAAKQQPRAKRALAKRGGAKQGVTKRKGKVQAKAKPKTSRRRR